MPNAQAQDKIVTVQGQTLDVKIIGVRGANIQTQVGSGVLERPLSSIASVVIAAPAEVAVANQAFEKRDYAKALAAAKAVNSKFLGLPVDWARETASLMGDIYVAMGQLKEAETAYADFQRAYPKAGSVQVDVGMARVAVSRKAFDAAAAKLEPIVAEAEKKPFDTSGDAVAYSQAFFLLGQVAEARNQPAQALEAYLKTITIYSRDATAVKSAQERVAALRKADPSLALP